MSNLQLWKLIFAFVEKLAIAWVRSQEKPEPTPEPPKPIPAPAPPPTNKPSDGRFATMYVPWDRREDWARKVDLAYTVWRGDRDLGYLLNRPDVMSKFGINAAALRADILEMQTANADGNRLIWRIKNEMHRKFRDRSQVRKDVVNAMVDRLERLTERYNTWRNKFPFGPEYDSIQGYIQWSDRNGNESSEPSE